MNQGKFIYSQLTDFLPNRVFDGLVAKYNGDKRVKHFSCWNQFLYGLWPVNWQRQSERSDG